MHLEEQAGPVSARQDRYRHANPPPLPTWVRQAAGTALALALTVLVVDHRLANWVGMWVGTWLVLSACAVALVVTR